MKCQNDAVQSKAAATSVHLTVSCITG